MNFIRYKQDKLYNSSNLLDSLERRLVWLTLQRLVMFIVLVGLVVHGADGLVILVEIPFDGRSVRCGDQNGRYEPLACRWHRLILVVLKRGHHDSLLLDFGSLFKRSTICWPALLLSI